MSQSYRQDCNEAKAAREGVIEQRPVRGKAAYRGKRTVVVEYRTKSRTGYYVRDWTPWFRKYHTVKQAEEAVTTMNRHGGYFEYRMPPCSGTTGSGLDSSS